MSEEATPASVQVPVKFIDGRADESWTVARLRVGQYEQAFTLFDKQQEVQRMVLVTDRPLNAINALDPDSYEALAAADLLVNRRFFAYSRRQTDWRRIMRADAGADTGPRETHSASTG